MNKKILDVLKNKIKVKGEFDFDFIDTFPPLGHPEHHFNKYPAHYWLKNEKDIREWLNLKIFLFLNEAEVIIHEDLTVSFKKEKRVLITGRSLPEEYNVTEDILINTAGEELPIKIREAGDVYLKRVCFNTLIGTPYKMEELSIVSCVNIKNLVGFSAYCKKIEFKGMQLESFKGMKVENSGRGLDMVFIKSDVNSWDGFTECDNLFWWQEKWNNENSEKLLDRVPKNIKKFYLNNSFIDSIPKELVKKYTAIPEDLKNEVINKKRTI